MSTAHTCGIGHITNNFVFASPPDTAYAKKAHAGYRLSVALQRKPQSDNPNMDYIGLTTGFLAARVIDGHVHEVSAASAGF